MHPGAEQTLRLAAPRTSLPIALTGIGCALLGMLMLSAWPPFFISQHTRTETALAITLAGLGVAAQITGHRRTKTLLGLGVLLLAAASGLESFLGRAVSFNPYLLEQLPGLPPSQMAPNTLLALLLIGLLLSLPASKPRLPALNIFRFALSGGAIVLGLSSAAGHLSGQPELYGWSQFVSMPPETATALFLLGLALLAADLLHTGLRGLRYSSFLIAAIIGGTSLLVWGEMKAKEAEAHQADIAQLASILARAIDNDLEAKAFALERMAKRWEVAGGTPRTLWEIDAEGYVADHGFVSLTWADAKGMPHWINPRSTNGTAGNTEPWPEPPRPEIMEKAQSARRLIFDMPETADAANAHVVVGLRALYVNDRLDGYLIAPLQLEEILGRATAGVLPAHVRVALKSDQQTLAQSGSLNGPAIDTNAEDKQALQQLPGIVIEVEHDADFLPAQSSHLPAFVLFSGLSAAALLGIALWFWQTALLRARENEAANAGIRDREARLTAIVHTAVEGIIIIDDHGIVESINPAAENLFGYASSEVSGRNVSMLMPEPYCSAHDGYMRRHLEGEAPRVIGFSREVVGLRKNGETFPMELAVSEMHVNGRRMFTGLTRDISERKQMEKMKAEFVSVVSHELRTPLTSISGALGLAASGSLGELSAQARQMIDIALKNSQRLTHLINDLLDMDKMAAGKMQFALQAQPLAPVVREAVATLRSYADQYQVRLSLNEPAEELRIRVDDNRLQQILINFLSNAIKFTPRGGEVKIAVCPHGDQARVQVADAGPGIPAEFRSRIFQKFSQADASDQRKTGGSGLGLAISKELAERMNGKVGFVSEEGRGATFFVEFPRLEPADEGKPARCGKFAEIDWLDQPPDPDRLLAFLRSALPLAANGRTRVLSVQGDEARYRSVSTLAGEIADFEPAHTLAEAGEKLARNRYDLVVLNIVLPDGNGLGLLPRIGAMQPQPRVVVLSAAELSGAQKAEAQATLAKSGSANEALLPEKER